MPPITAVFLHIQEFCYALSQSRNTNLLSECQYWQEEKAWNLGFLKKCYQHLRINNEIQRILSCLIVDLIQFFIDIICFGITYFKHKENENVSRWHSVMHLDMYCLFAVFASLNQLFELLQLSRRLQLQ
ncbi:hypothetical protein ACJX0J_028996 [Zea mays]